MQLGILGKGPAFRGTRRALHLIFLHLRLWRRSVLHFKKKPLKQTFETNGFISEKTNLKNRLAKKTPNDPEQLLSILQGSYHRKTARHQRFARCSLQASKASGLRLEDLGLGLEFRFQGSKCPSVVSPGLTGHLNPEHVNPKSNETQTLQFRV